MSVERKCIWDRQNQELQLISHRPRQRATLPLGHRAWPHHGCRHRAELCRWCQENLTCPQTLTPSASRQAGQKTLYTVKTNVPQEALPTTPRVSHHRLMVLQPGRSSSPRPGTCLSWPPRWLFVLSSKKLSSHSGLRGAETTFPQELKCQDDTRKPGWSLSQQEGGCYSSNLLW